MTSANYNLEKFIDLTKTDGRRQDKILSNAEASVFPEFNDYHELKSLLRKGERTKAKHLIKSGCCLNLNYNDSNDHSFDGSPLHLAVSLEDSEMVQLMLEKGASLYASNHSDETPLMLAAVVGNSQIIDMILTRTSPRRYIHGREITHFHIACMRNNVELVRKYLVTEMDVNVSVDKKSLYWPGFSPLHFAVEFRCFETAKLLIESGADITIQDNQSLTPLHLAFRKRNRNLVELLLQQQYYHVTNPVDSDGMSHFHIACAMNEKGIVEDFLAKKIDVGINEPYCWQKHCGFIYAINNESADVLECLLKCDYLILKRNNKQVIQCAYAKRNKKILNLVIHGIEKYMVSMQTSQCKESQHEESLGDKIDNFKRYRVSQYTELHVAILQKNKNKVDSILQAHHPSIVTMKDARGRTPLHLAFEINQKDLVHQLSLLHLQLDENPVDSDNLSHFHISCTTKNVSVVENFINKGADVNMTNSTNSRIRAGCTPLHFAILYDRLKVVKLLLDNEADFTLKNALGISPYDLSLPDQHDIPENDDEDCGFLDVAEQILLAREQRGIDNFEDHGLTLLFVASRNGDTKKIKKYANVDTINKRITEYVINWNQCTPLHVAAYCGLNDALKTLLDCGADPALQNHDQATPGHIHGEADDRLLLIPELVYDRFGSSMFHVACRSGSMNGVQHFFKLGADVNERVPHGCCLAINEDESQTPLHLAVTTGNPEIVKFLLELGVNVNARDCDFCTPLHFCQNKIILAMLLDHGADPEALNCDYLTAIDGCFIHAHEADFMTAVIENGWDINRRKINSNILNSSNSIVLARHIERLKVLNVHMNKDSEDLYKLISRKYSDDYHDRFHFKSKCRRELKLLEVTKINNHTSCYDILFKSSRELVNYCKNEVFQNIAESKQNLQLKYPIYGYLINLQYKKGLKRIAFLEEGKKSLSLLANRWMGDLVFEHILQFLNDHEITYLIYATSGQNIFQ